MIWLEWRFEKIPRVSGRSERFFFSFSSVRITYPPENPELFSDRNRVVTHASVG